MEMILEQEGLGPRAVTRVAEVEEALARMDRRTRSFVVLSNPTGAYVQTAGGPERLTVEYRVIATDSFRHFVLGRSGGGQDESSIETSGGSIRVQTSEVLTLADALAVFRAFLETGEPPSGYSLRETTEMFQ
jgi:hypothetical protein